MYLSIVTFESDGIIWKQYLIGANHGLSARRADRTSVGPNFTALRHSHESLMSQFGCRELQASRAHAYNARGIAFVPRIRLDILVDSAMYPH